ncbi:MAG: hypothetical protein UHK44_08050 [Bacteroidaceae bacterium]|jgi:hypothetical protein|nr:hypothetical protein [Paludibacteraceae bacterium]MEE1288535.1 hypothetical protein [Bacteroidaceae bacterium]
MPRQPILEICSKDLFTAEDELLEKYNAEQAQRVLRLRDMYNYYISNPDTKDRQFVDTAMSRHGIMKSQAYADLSIIKSLLPLLSSASRDFHRFRFNEMILETYQMAKARKDTKTMEKAASSYAKFNRVDLEDEQALPYDLIVVQPFTATSDPRVLGIKPIPNVEEKIAAMLKKYRQESMDIDDVDYEEVDLEEEELFNPKPLHEE